jgi:hypothetical protein
VVGLKLKVLIFNLHDQNQLEGDDLSGKVKLNVEPLPTSLSTQIFPRVAQQTSWPELALTQFLPSCAHSHRPPGETPRRSSVVQLAEYDSDIADRDLLRILASGKRYAVPNKIAEAASSVTYDTQSGRPSGAQ